MIDLRRGEGPATAVLTLKCGSLAQEVAREDVVLGEAAHRPWGVRQDIKNGRERCIVLTPRRLTGAESCEKLRHGGSPPFGRLPHVPRRILQEGRTHVRVARLRQQSCDHASERMTSNQGRARDRCKGSLCVRPITFKVIRLGAVGMAVAAA